MKRSALLLFVSLFFSTISTAAPPVVQIETDYQVAPFGTPVIVTVKLDSLGDTGKNADWFLGDYNRTAGWYHYNQTTGKLVQDTGILTLMPTYQGPLKNTMTSSVLGVLPSGNNLVFAGVDTTMNGYLDPVFFYALAAVDIGNDCRIALVRKVEDKGYTGIFEFLFHFNQLGQAQYFVHGQSNPNDDWIRYTTRGSDLQWYLEWPNGEDFEFSLGGTISGVDHYADPACSAYRHPTSAASNVQHLKLTLGAKKISAMWNNSDTLVKGIYREGSQYRVYLDFSKLPIKNYRKITVFGQSGQNRAWVDYPVTDNFPDYFIRLNWPISGSGFEFTFKVTDEFGVVHAVNPTTSNFNYNGHLMIPSGAFALAPLLP